MQEILTDFSLWLSSIKVKNPYFPEKTNENMRSGFHSVSCAFTQVGNERGATWWADVLWPTGDVQTTAVWTWLSEVLMAAAVEWFLLNSD